MSGMRSAARASAVALIVATLAPGAAHAGGGPIRPHAVELGADADLSLADGVLSGRVAIGAGTFLEIGHAGLIALGLEVGWLHAAALDAFDTGVFAQWIPPWSWHGVVPFAGLAAGLRPERVGSFSTLRVPVGGDAGVRLVLGHAVEARITLRARAVLADPTGPSAELRLTFGLAWLAGNR